MTLNSRRLTGILPKGFLFGLTMLCCTTVTTQACTIFVLTDPHRALFCNNEDWSNPKTRVWFVPAGKGYLGCAYVGFDNGWAQGGLNAQGLAFDWVAGFKEVWRPGPELKSVRGNSSARMLETCTNVQDAIAFYRQHRETSFTYAKMLVADRTGASVIIGAKDGKFQAEQANQCRGFGYERRTLYEMLAENSEATVANGASILRACVQKGQYATKYSNVFDLKSGDIFLFLFPDQAESVKLNLADELKKGPHYYDIPKVRQQLSQPSMPLLNNMKRFILDEYKPIRDREPELTKHFRDMMQDAFGGVLRPDDFTAECWKEISPTQEELQAQTKALGSLVTLALVDRRAEGARRSYTYRMEFQKATVLQRFVLDERSKVALIETEGAEPKAEGN
jgi:hypothetical protein